MSKRNKKEKKNKVVKKDNKKVKADSIYFYLLIGIVLIIFLISIINTTANTNENGVEEGYEKVDFNNFKEDSQVEIKDNDLNNETKINAEYRIDEFSKLEDFLGRPSVILFAGTYCGHCTALVPEFEKEIWDKYSDIANIWVQVVNNDTFNVDRLKQGTNSNLNYNDITNGNCRYIPSFLVLDSEGNVELKSCGSEKSLEDIKNKLDTLVST